MAVNVGFRSINSGALANGGEDIVLHASADDREANALLPVQEVPGLAILLLQLLQLSQQARARSAPVEAPVLEGQSMEVAPGRSPDREVLHIRIASDATASGAKAAILGLSLPNGSLRGLAESILRSADDVGDDDAK